MVDEGGPASTTTTPPTIDQPILIEKQNLSPCHVCGRTFLPASLRKHEKICEKNATKKRKVFDSLKQRVEGTDLAAFHQKSYLKRQPIEPVQVECNRIKRQSQWKEKHLELVNAIRAAKGQNTTQMSTPVRKTAPVMAPNERCPSCDRQFGPKAYDRHVEWCKERKARIHHSPANVLLAKERLEARIRYRVPPIKTKRQANKEKYSGGTSPTEMSTSLTSTSKVGSFSRGPSIRRPKPVAESGTSTSTSSSSHNKYPEKKEKSPVRVVPKSPILERVQSKTKSTPTQKSSSTTPQTYDPFESAQRQFEQLLESDDFLSHVKRPQTATIKESKLPQNLIEKRGSIIDPPTYFKDSFDSITDDFEMLENMINSNLIDDKNISIDSFFLNLQQPVNDSAKNRKLSDDVSLIIDPSLINENDNLSIPDHFKVDNSYSPVSTGESDITIRNESDVYSEQCDRKIEEEFSSTGDIVNKTRVSSSKTNHDFSQTRFNKYESNLKDSFIDIEQQFKNDNKFDKKIDKNANRNDSTAKKVNIERKKSQVLVKKDNNMKSNKTKLTSSPSQNVTSDNAGRGDYDKKKSFKKQNSLFDVAPKKPPSLKSKAEVENYFNSDKSTKSNNRNRKSPDLEEKEMETILKPEDLFAVDDEMYEEYKKYEEMYLREKQQKAKSKKQKPKLIDVNYGLLTASEEDDMAQLNKLSNDSAYGSLTRKTPKRNRNTKLSPLEQKNPDSTSSSGSEHNPTANTAKQDLSSFQEQQRLSKFCHECGQKYPLNSAKFCVECGVRRLVL